MGETKLSAKVLLERAHDAVYRLQQHEVRHDLAGTSSCQICRAHAAIDAAVAAAREEERAKTEPIGWCPHGNVIACWEGRDE